MRMIHYELQCDKDHAFDGWFKDSISFDHQAASGLIACPLCSSIRVRRALMAPALSRRRPQAGEVSVVNQADPAPTPADSSGSLSTIAPPPSGAAGTETAEKLRSLLQRLRSEVEKHCDYVGPQFAEEARRIHYGESKSRGIYGETTSSEAEALADEGIAFGVVPWLRRSDS
ncbi:DUF1178 family protein [Acidisoma sp.]|uniref:DUF1178 family protein n=1 Tax=Acidisoma sp. TaxID=1872115 RepID=UPI003B009122